MYNSKRKAANNTTVVHKNGSVDCVISISKSDQLNVRWLTGKYIWYLTIHLVKNWRTDKKITEQYIEYTQMCCDIILFNQRALTGYIILPKTQQQISSPLLSNCVNNRTRMYLVCCLYWNTYRYVNSVSRFILYCDSSILLHPQWWDNIKLVSWSRNEQWDSQEVVNYQSSCSCLL